MQVPVGTAHADVLFGAPGGAQLATSERAFGARGGRVQIAVKCELNRWFSGGNVSSDGYEARKSRNTVSVRAG
jgi:hypothetical protein